MNSNDVVPPVLVVDDSEDDVFFLKRALAAAGLKHRCVVFEDGAEVMIYLKGLCAMARSGGPTLPPLLFTDLRMSRVGGFEVLAWVRAQPELRGIACVVVSTSELEGGPRAGAGGRCVRVSRETSDGGGIENAADPHRDGTGRRAADVRGVA